MNLPQYITPEEVASVCRQLKIRDWTTIADGRVTLDEARIILGEMRVEERIDPEDFRRGLEVELEHGTRFPDANVTNNHPILTGKIVLAHLKETLDYYSRLEIAELEGDLMKSITAAGAAKLQDYSMRLAQARIDLAQREAKKLSNG
ncbi:MAG: hypothetical protein LLG01_18875 [Planctomycetaceae bacterium]|nr:hypothetical protein [Planctomycetaceae bacterium]